MAENTPAKSIGVGLISVGWMGRLHSRAYNSLPLIYPELGIHPTLVQAADVAEAGRTYATDVLGYASAVADYHEVLANPEVDVVSICAPNFLHAEIGIAAAKAGKPFWIEKPVGRGASETEAVEAAADEAGVVTCIGFNYRHVPAIQRARELVLNGSLGQITNIRGRFFGGFSSNPNDPLAWRFVREYSGSGVLGDLMGHLVDLVHYVLGPIGSITATTGTYITERPALPHSPQAGTMLPVENEDYATMLVKFDDSAVAAGALGSLEASRIAVGPRSEYGIEIFGTKGSVRWEFERLNELEIALGNEGPNTGYIRAVADAYFPDFARFQPSSGTSMGYDDLKTIEAAKFLLAVTGGEATNSNIHDAVASARVLTAAEESAASGSWIDLPLVAGATANTRTLTTEGQKR
ncbi:putative dehydrogenase [Frondihabitans sp. PhB188]|uniref:Gfo/Idh/MocA family protein n=1 Tax=Frondihabitans sp. PhB188 TaxID=2485200 RepID=UPI000F4A9B9C|nr:Gfo/Idh/MocA family oxidoreductase [Frondihabitans sp. PhB188]ROQ30311.1 putative dehydrogenase [Frondihabitans sp. PhB188]